MSPALQDILPYVRQHLAAATRLYPLEDNYQIYISSRILTKDLYNDFVRSLERHPDMIRAWRGPPTLQLYGRALTQLHYDRGKDVKGSGRAVFGIGWREGYGARRFKYDPSPPHSPTHDPPPLEPLPPVTQFNGDLFEDEPPSTPPPPSDQSDLLFPPL